MEKPKQFENFLTVIPVLQLKHERRKKSVELLKWFPSQGLFV